jgi:hypothetical protein
LKASRAGVWQDVRFGVRALRRSPGVSALAIGALALGVGLSTAAFSIVNAVLFRPVPVHEPDRLVYEYQVLPDGQAAVTDVRALEFLRQRGDVFEGLTAHCSIRTSSGLATGASPRRARSSRRTTSTSWACGWPAVGGSHPLKMR